MNLTVRVSRNRLRGTQVLLTISLMLLIAGILLHLGASQPMASSLPAYDSPWERTGQTSASFSPKAGAGNSLAHLPLNFEANQGQTDGRVKFLARGTGYTVFLTQDEAVMKLAAKSRSSVARPHSLARPQSRALASVVRMKLVGANRHAAITGSEQSPSRSNYFVGKDPSKWRRNVPHFSRVRYRQVYPGVDLVYYGNQGQLEYDFEIAAGADPKQIDLKVDGGQNLHLDARGDLVAETPAGDLRLRAPTVYQRVGGEKRTVTGKFLLSEDHRLHVVVGHYDRTRVLVIDPVLNYSSYLGGTGDEGCAFISGAYTTAIAGCPAISVDAANSIYVAGATTSATFPVTGSPLQANNAGSSDAFIAKFNVTSSSVYTLAYWTFLGGSSSETTAGIAVDSSLNVYVAGNTSSTTTNNFPTTSNGNQTVPPSSGIHGFVSVLNPSGSALTYSTYVEGDGTDTITGLAIDAHANAYITGTTTSTSGFPITAGAIQTSPQSTNPQFFLTKLNTQPANGTSSLLYSTYFGSTLPSSGAIVQGGGVAVDPLGSAYITGETNFLSSGSGGSFPILNAYQPCLDAPGATACTSPTSPDAFVAKIDTNASAGAQLKYSTYLGGGGIDIPYAVAVDGGGNAYVTGTTTSTDFPIANGTDAFQATFGGGSQDAFVAKFGNPGPTVPLVYSSYLGGPGNDIGYAVAVDLNQAAHVAGSTTSGFPQVHPISSINPGPGAGINAFVALIQTAFAGQSGGYSSYLGTTGANGNSDATGIATDANGNSYVAGETNSSAFPVTNSSVLNGAASDAFVSKIVPLLSGLTITASTSVASSTIGIGNQVSFIYTITNAGPDVASNLILTDTLPPLGATFASASATPGSCTAVVNGTVACSIGSLGTTTATVKINLTPTIAGSVSNSASLQANGVAVGSANASATVTDFAVGVSPSTNAVLAGNSATYQVQVGVPAGQTNFFPNSIALSCSAGVPTGAACAFSTSPVSSTLTITTTARPVPTAEIRNVRFWYAAVLPVTGLTFLGIGAGASRKKRWLLALLGMLPFALASFQLACSSGSGSATPPTGTPAGTYAITITGTSGSAAHASRATLVVQ